LWYQELEFKANLKIDFLSVAEKFNILPHCEFNTLCTSMVWDDCQQLWSCAFQNTITRDIFVREAPVVISEIGTLDRPNIPEIEGSSVFQGHIFHSARWDSAVDVENKNVIVLGNGASATQFVPELVKKVAPHGKVTQLVKSAHWWTKRVSYNAVTTHPILDHHLTAILNRKTRYIQDSGCLL
jgi:cation diffusion facilitator CzcD-associated flavoprotein CzcO